MADAGENDDAPDDRPETAPTNFSVSVLGLDAEERATRLAHLIGAYVRELSRYVDLAGLDGITVAGDYSQALLDLDRGYETSHRLTPSEDGAIGIAMTPSVIRDGELKSHIVLNAGLAIALEDTTSELFRLALHTLFHECAHVEITQRFDAAFPNFLLRKRHDDLHTTLRWQIILACWDEYAATWISAPVGEDPTAGYEQTFILSLERARARANELIKAYRCHGDAGRIMGEVYGVYGELMKFASYHLGNMAGRGLSLSDLPATAAALEGHWFAPYFDRLAAACKRIADDYGAWADQSMFEALGDLADEIIIERGLTVSHLDDGNIHVDVPFTAETMPNDDCH